MKKKIWIGSIAGVLLVTLGVLSYLIFSVSPMQESYTYELGESITCEKEDYLSGVSWAVNMWEFDFSGVQENTTGTYEVTAKSLNRLHTFQVIIRDTVAPEITPMEGPLYFEVGTDICMDQVVSKYADKDRETQIAFLSGAEKQDMISSDIMGENILTVCAWDSSGNETQVNIPVILDTPPEFAGIREFYLACGYEADFLENITASDTVDGDVSSQITLVEGDLNTEAAGEYEIIYQATDSYGLTGEQSAMVYVMEQMDLQTAINTHQIDRNEQTIVGAINLYDGGYYEEDNVEFIHEAMTPARVRIRFDGKDGSWSFGSGFIISMDEEEIILCTNHHVVSGREKWDVYFFDGTKVEGTVIGTKKKQDIGFVKVAASEVPTETFEQLMTVHINKGYWDALGNTEPINVGLRCIDNEGGVWRDREGTMKEKMLTPGTMPELPKTDHQLWVNLSQFHGASGSAILDGHGNLIGMSSNIVRYYDRGTYQLGVNLQEILLAYEEIVGEVVYYE